MTSEQKFHVLTVSVPEEFAQMIHELVDKGEYKNASQFVRKAISTYFWKEVEHANRISNYTTEMENKMLRGEEKCK